MNIIINASNKNVGGVETFFTDLAIELSKIHLVFFLVDSNENYYSRNLDSTLNIHYIYKGRTSEVEYLYLSQIKKEKHYLLNQIDLSLDYIIISPYFQSFQYSLAIFGDLLNFQLFHIWSHPNSWIKTISFLKPVKFLTSKKFIKSKKYLYQRKLLTTLNSNKANFFGSSAIVNYNNWLYEVDLQNEFDFPLLVKSKASIDTKRISYKSGVNTLRVLWLGRFNWFKNESIIHVFKTLEYLQTQYIDFVISFDIAGYGEKHDLEYLVKNIKSDILSVNFLGAIDFSNLGTLFLKYDIGIGMGLTVKNMADFSLPAILIDSLSNSDISQLSSIWFYNSDLGDSGDNFYNVVSGSEVYTRYTLLELIEDIILNITKLNDLSVLCKSHFDFNYSLSRNLKKLEGALLKSEFNGKNFQIYRHNLIVINAYQITYYIVKRNKTFFLKLLKLLRKVFQSN